MRLEALLLLLASSRAQQVEGLRLHHESGGAGAPWWPWVWLVVLAAAGLGFGWGLARLRRGCPGRAPLEGLPRPGHPPRRFDREQLAGLLAGPLSAYRVVLLDPSWKGGKGRVHACRERGVLPVELVRAVEDLAARTGEPVALVVAEPGALEGSGEPLVELARRVGGRFPLWACGGPADWEAWEAPSAPTAGASGPLLALLLGFLLAGGLAPHPALAGSSSLLPREHERALSWPERLEAPRSAPAPWGRVWPPRGRWFHPSTPHLLAVLLAVGGELGLHLGPGLPAQRAGEGATWSTSPPPGAGPSSCWDRSTWPISCTATPSPAPWPCSGRTTPRWCPGARPTGAG